MIDRAPAAQERTRHVPRKASVAIVEDADGYERSVHGVAITSVRTGRGSGPNVVLAASFDQFQVTSVSAGFPMVNRTTIGDDRFLAAVVRSTPPGGSWCDIDLEAGSVVVFGPEAKHIGVNPDGIDFAFIAVELEVVEELADSVRLPFTPPPRGRVAALQPSPQTTALGSTLSSFVDAVASGATPVRTAEDDILHRVTGALSADRRPWRLRPASLDSRHIVFICTEYAEASQRIPSIKELCQVAHVSERRLRGAFTDTYRMPPTQYFRKWALEQARRRLVHAEPHLETVTNVAFDLGFYHLGRFAAYYKTLYGENPRTTLWSRHNRAE